MGKQKEIKNLTAGDFAEAFGTTEKEVLVFCGNIIADSDFRYEIYSGEKRESIFYDALSKCDSNYFTISESGRKQDWSRGWGEILRDFENNPHDLSILKPRDIHGDRPLRFKGDYIHSISASFEYSFFSVFRTWLYKKYFSDYQHIYEFGCGTGHNLILMASLFDDKNYYGFDWTPESQKILEIISNQYGWNIQAGEFDFFNPDYDIDFKPGSLVYTSAALEQVGREHDKFTDFLLNKKPDICINVEPISEYYGENIFDYVALKYHTKRNYLDGFYTSLKQLEKENTITILATKRVGFGSVYHEAFSYVIWKVN